MAVPLTTTDSLDCVQDVLQGLHEDLQRHLVVDKSLASRMYGWKPRSLIGHGEMAQINSQVDRGLPMDAFRTWYDHAHSNYTTEYLQEFCKCLRSESEPAKPKLAQVAVLITKEIDRGVGEGSHSEQSPSTTELPEAKRSARDSSRAEQLHRQKYTQGPTAPRTGMDEKIGRGIDILKVPEYREGLIGEMTLLGFVLGIGEDANAILRTHGSVNDHLLEILDLYIAVKIPTWQDFCEALKRSGCFNLVRAKIGADHDDINRLALEKLQTAIEKRGSVTLHITRCILIGPPRVGKSCFKNLLVHNEPCLVKESTPVMEAPVVLTSMWTQQGKEGTWKELKPADFQNLVSKCAMDGKYYRRKNDGGNSTAEPLAEQPKNEGHNSIATADDDKPNPVVPAADNLSQRLSNFLQVMSRDDIGMDLNHLKLMHIFDCGGQLAFQDTIPLLINAPCAFIAIFNAFEGLDEEIELTYCLGGKELPTGHKETQRNMLRSILSSIQSLQYKCHQDLKDLIKEPPKHYSPIAVVGTHKDKIVHSDIDSIKDCIETQLRDLNGSMPCEFIEIKGQILNLVGNLTPNDLDQIVLLREEISKNATFIVDLPLPWLILELFTRSDEQAFYRYSEFKELCDPLLMEEGDFNACIRILHILGFYAYYPLRELPENENWICTDAATLYKEVSKLLMVQHVNDGNNTTVNFKKTGRIPLKEEALKELFKDLKISIRVGRKWLMHVLLHLGLAAKIKMKRDSDEEDAFIPLALPSGLSDIPSKTSVAPLCFTLDFTNEDSVTVSANSTGIPRGTFSRLVVLLLRGEFPGYEVNKWKIDDEGSKRSCIKFSLFDSSHTVYLKENMCHIEASVVLGEASLLNDNDDNRTREGSRHCQDIRQTLTAALQKAFELVFGTSCQPKVVCGLACSQCDSSNGRYNHLAIIRQPPSPNSKKYTAMCVLNKGNRYFPPLDILIWFNGLVLYPAFKFTCKTVDGNKLWILEESSTSGPTAPRTGMDEKIGCSLDILKVPECREGLIDEMKSLGSALGIEKDTKAILNRHGSRNDHLLEILGLYIEVKIPTWQDFCKALKGFDCFNSVRAKIEADHDK